MRLCIPLMIALVALPLATLAPAASAGPFLPPVCLVKEVGDQGGKVWAEVWVTCGPNATVMTCPKDGFCTVVATEDLLP